MIKWNEIINRMMIVFSVTTQKELSEALGVSQDLVSNWRKNKATPTWKMLDYIIEKTNVSWEWLMTGKSDDPSMLIKIFAGTSLGELPYFRNLGIDFISLALTHEEYAAYYSRVANVCFFLCEFFDQFIDYDGVLNELPQNPSNMEQLDDIAEILLGEEVANDLKEIGYDGDRYQMGEWVFLEIKKALKPTPIQIDELKKKPKATSEPLPFILEADSIPVVGEAAADETEGSRAGFFPPNPEAHYNELDIPDTTAAVRVIGNSMSPVLLDGQYAIIGPEYFGSSHPNNYDIVIADVEIEDEDQAGSDARWTGLYCKRIVDAGDIWVFLSINQTGTPFSVAKSNCRLWPVIGVWFAGKGKPPAED